MKTSRLDVVRKDYRHKSSTPQFVFAVVLGKTRFLDAPHFLKVHFEISGNPLSFRACESSTNMPVRRTRSVFHRETIPMFGIAKALSEASLETQTADSPQTHPFAKCITWKSRRHRFHRQT